MIKEILIIEVKTEVEKIFRTWKGTGTEKMNNIVVKAMLRTRLSGFGYKIYISVLL